MEQSLTELIERLEKATGPDRELDVAAWEFAPLAKTHNPRTVRGHIDELVVPRFTASIDAALTLSPKFLRLELKGDCDDGWAAFLIDGDVREFRGDHNSMPAIALCIAALKARAHHS